AFETWDFPKDGVRESVRLGARGGVPAHFFGAAGVLGAAAGAGGGVAAPAGALAAAGDSCALLKRNCPISFSSTTADWVIVIRSPVFSFCSSPPASSPT